MEKKARKTGLDILKIFSMIFVIIYHITLYGVDLVNIQQYSMPYWMITGLKCVSIVSVNCFILVTGYFLSKSHVNYKKLIGLWIQVEMYSVGVYLFLCMLPGTGIDFQVKILLKQMLPILTNQYWFFTDYLLLMVFIPLLNIFVQNVSRKKFKRTLFVLLITFSVLPTFNIFGDPFGTNKGFSIIWFIIVYLIAAYLRWYPIAKKRWGIIWMLFTLAIFGVVAVSDVFSNIIPQILIVQNLIFAYNSVPVILASVSLFLTAVYAKDIINERVGKIISRLAVLSFSAYLLHEHSQIRDVLWNQWINLMKYVDSPMLFAVRIVTSIVLIFAAAILIEYCRSLLVEKVFYGRLRKSPLKSILDILENEEDALTDRQRNNIVDE